jgi:succinylarginine dihydrolase
MTWHNQPPTSAVQEKVREVNFDGLIGPSHHYGGLAVGNLASARNALSISSPRQAALQGLEKMRTLVRLGYTQGFIPPQQRPDLDVLRQLGFHGNDVQIIQQAAQTAPALLAMVYSASGMWAANAATVTPSSDNHDGRLHLTPANLLTTAHRAIEHRHTQRLLQQLFADHSQFVVHEPLPSIHRFADEGAANHSRLCNQYSDTGVGLFVYGRDTDSDTSGLQYPARQTLEACQALARQQRVKHALFLQQSREAINAGAFHNDVVAVANGPVLFYHQHAYEAHTQQTVFAQLRQHVDFNPIEVPAAAVSLDDAIRSYLFNSQLLAAADGSLDAMTLIAPSECAENPAVSAYLHKLLQEHSQPIRQVHYVDVRQSMSNGGGPACLRLRVVLSEQQLAAINPAFIVNEEKIDQLQSWVMQHYREQLSPADLADPALFLECRAALKALGELLDCPMLYPDL